MGSNVKREADQSLTHSQTEKLAEWEVNWFISVIVSGVPEGDVVEQSTGRWTPGNGNHVKREADHSFTHSLTEWQIGRLGG
jgi:hypothetical protein